MQTEGRNTGKESDGEIDEDDIVEEIKVINGLEGATKIKEGSIPQETKAEEINEEDGISENEQQDSTEVHPDERQNEIGKLKKDKHEEISENEKLSSPSTVIEIGRGVGRTVVISKNRAPKVYQVKSVPVVPPKPQHSKITTFKQQFQHSDKEKQLISIKQFERGFAKKEKETEHQEHTTTEEEEDTGRNDHQNTEHEKETQENKACHSFGGEREEKKGLRQRRGTWDGGCRRKDVQKDVDKEMKRTSGSSMCFDEAFAWASGKLCREKETTEKERFIYIHWERRE